jgi:hypothetical protein
MLGLSSSLVKGGASLLTFVKDNLKLYLDFNSKKSDTLKFPSEGSTEFDGSGDRIDCGQIDVSGQSITLSAWVYRDGTTDDTIAGRWSSNGAMLYCSGSSVLWYVNGNNSNVSIPDKTWVHIVGTFDGVNRKVYKDGVLGDTDADTGTIVNPSENFEIGNAEFSSGKGFKGKLANVAMWSRALTQEEVQSIMNKSYSQLKGVEKTSLVAWWALDDVQKVTDNSVSSGLIESETGEILSSDVKSFDSITGLGNNYTNNILEFVKNGYAFFNISGIAQGKLYRLTYTVLTQTGSGLAHSGGSSAFTGGIPTTVGSHEQYLVAGSANLLVMRSTGFRGTITDIVLQEVSNTGVVTGATTTTSVYGGNAPILPRAVDVAKEGQVDAIGDGSASFNGSTDYIDVGSDSLLDDIWTGGGTITGWINSHSIGENTGFYVVKRSSQPSGWHISNKDESGDTCKLRFAVRWDNFGQWTTTSRDITYNEWIHIAVSYDNSSTSNNPTIYINGVSVAITTVTAPSGTYVSDASDNLYIGGEAGDFTTDGNISQLGIWQGILTQAQIQSLMESTSYSNIPADVKSTLGSEILTTNVDTNWSAYGSNDVDTVTDGVKITHVDNAGGAQRTIAGSSGKLYKVVFNAYYSGGTAPNVRVWTGAVNSGTQALTTSSTQHTIYFVNAGTSSLYFDSVNGSQEIFITNLSAKEVTNDIVAYYPLDGSSEVKGLNFDGVDDYITVADNDSLDQTTEITIITWAKHSTSTSDYDELVAKYTSTGSNNRSYAFAIDSNEKLIFTVSADGTDTIGSQTSDSALSTIDEWHQYAVTFSSGTCKLFQDGVEIASTASSMPSSIYAGASTLLIGAINTGALSWAGQISSTSIYSTAKSAEEVLAIYNDGIGGDESSNSGLVGYWKMDNATTVTDLSGNGNNGTVNGGATLISAGTTDSVGNNDGGLY